MTEKYVRKKVSVRRGLGQDNRPLPEKADEEDGGHGYNYSHNYSYRDSAFAEDSFDDVSEPSTAQTQTGRHSWLAMSNGWTTGHSTERSSIYSFGEDEFDREASKKVRHLFEDIEKMLYENYQGPEPLRTECKDWVKIFPHLRVSGRQLLSPQDNGYQMVPSVSSLTTPHSEDILESDAAFSHFSVMGQQMAVLAPPIDSIYTLPENDSSSYEMEEIFAMDGVLEDIIAIDKSIQEEDDRNSGYQSGHRKTSGYPPVNPKALLKENTGSIVFDTIWSEVISWLRLILRKYSSRIIPENPFDLDDQLLPLDDPILPVGYLPDERREDTMGVMGPSREISYISGVRMVDRYVPRLGTASSTSQGIARTVGLDGLLTISSKALQSREKSSLQSEHDAVMTSRPESSFLPYHLGRQNSARIRAQRGKLAPIDRIRTPSLDDERHAMRPTEVLRGRSIGASSNDVLPQALGLHRNGTLPPIALESDTSYGKRKQSSRASSAVHDKDSHMAFRERTRDSLIMESARPSTTHALYRAETSLGNRQRSSTPQLFNSSRISHGPMPLSGLGSGGTTNILQLNVTGNSIYPHQEEDVNQSIDMESQYDSVMPQNWGPQGVGRRNTRTQYNSMGPVTEENILSL